jgi:hypothetical protein
MSQSGLWLHLVGRDRDAVTGIPGPHLLHTDLQTLAFCFLSKHLQNQNKKSCLVDTCVNILHSDSECMKWWRKMHVEFLVYLLQAVQVHLHVMWMMPSVKLRGGWLVLRTWTSPSSWKSFQVIPKPFLCTKHNHSQHTPYSATFKGNSCLALCSLSGLQGPTRNFLPQSCSLPDTWTWEEKWFQVTGKYCE